MRWFSFVGDVVYLYKIARRKPPLPTPSTERGIFFLEPSYTAASITSPPSVRRSTIVSVTAAAIVIHAVMCACILPIPLSLVSGIMADREIERHGLTTRATVINCTQTRSNRPDVIFTYSVLDGDSMRQLTDEAFGNYNQVCVHEGASILIQYLPEDPTATRLIEPGLFADNADLTLLLLTGIPAVFLLLAVLFKIGVFVKSSLRYRQFVTRGMFLPGEIVQAAYQTQRGERKLQIEYVFTTPDHRTLQGYQSRVRLDPGAEKMAMPGIPIWVLYLDDHNYLML